MGKRGPQPLPTAIKRLNGNPGLRALNEHEPQPERALPDPPAHLGELARQQWQEVGPMLFRLRVMTEADTAALALYCETYQHYREAVAERKKYGVAMVRRLRDDSGDYVEVRRNPFAVEEHKYRQALLVLMREFGLTPSSRSGIVTADAQENPLSKYGIVG